MWFDVCAAVGPRAAGVPLPSGEVWPGRGRAGQQPSSRSDCHTARLRYLLRNSPGGSLGWCR